jgi:hypothetical protein
MPAQDKAHGVTYALESLMGIHIDPNQLGCILQAQQAISFSH